MFKRILYEDWATWVPIAAFILTAGVFLVFSIRAVFMGREQSNHMAKLPLETDEQES